MTKSAKKGDPKKAKTKALWKTTSLFVVFGSLIFTMLWWARTDSESAVAWKIRNLLGIELATQTEPATEREAIQPMVERQPEAETETQTKTQTETQTEPLVTPEPVKAESLDWDEFINRPNIWPETLKIMVDQEVTLTYHGNTYGRVSFKKGQPLNVDGFSEEGYASGRSGGNEMEVHVSETNFNTWFQDQHGDQLELSIPEKQSSRQADDFEEELITELRLWALRNYNTPLIEINENNLVLYWRPRSRGTSESNYALEALSVARAYLRIQTKLGGKDNYATCEIRDPDTDKLIGSKGAFIPRF